MPAEVRQELDALIGHAIDASAPILASSGRVLPFALAQPVEGKPAVMATGLDEGSGQAAAESRSLLREMLGRQAAEGTLRCAAVIYDSLTLKPDADVSPVAICIQVEHVKGFAADAFVTFKRGWFRTRITGEMFALDAPLRIFPRPAGDSPGPATEA